jgi:hypothetical protein
MKQLLKSFFVLATLAVLTFQISGCKKDCPVPPAVTYPIQGLWVGTFTTVSGFAVPPGSSYYFSLSIYPDGTLSYKSGTSNPSLYVYAAGTWTLTGDSFSFSAKTINGVSSSQDSVAGTATFDKNKGTLSNGIVNSNTSNTSATWKMSRVN